MGRTIFGNTRNHGFPRKQGGAGTGFQVEVIGLPHPFGVLRENADLGRRRSTKQNSRNTRVRIMLIIIDVHPGISEHLTTTHSYSYN
jgi:hypothetical protein